MVNHVRALRTARNWTQAELAEKLKVSRNSVNAIETGRYEPSLTLALRIARLFKLPVERIFESED
jgi:putative transcriptional regulator